MGDYLRLKKARCKDCHKCIRSCPVKSIRFSGEQANIIADECILCGRCYVACPQNAKEIRNDTDAVKADIAAGKRVIANLAPSFVANWSTNLASMADALKRLGFADVSETAIGASMVKKRYEQMISAKDKDLIISSCCPAVNQLIMKYYPEALPYLADVVTPMEANARRLKREDPACSVVFIGPCIAKKKEGDASQYVDHVLAFTELSDWLKDEGIRVEHIEEPELEQSRSRLFPIPGGILGSMDKEKKGWSYVVVDGMENCIKALKDIIKGRLKNCFVEMSACAGSCVSGPTMETARERPVTDYVMVDSYAGCEDYTVAQPAAQELHSDYPRTPVPNIMVSDQEISETLKKMGKTLPEHELNCGACGYRTCREKAAAVCQGKAEITMCLPFLRSKAESFSDTIIKNTPNGVIVLNEELEIQQLNAAACDIMNLHSAAQAVGMQAVTLLDPLPFLEVMRTGRMIRARREYLAEYGKYVEMTVLYERNYKIVIGIMRDITTEVNSDKEKDYISEQTAEAADKVIDKQMRVVQEIASLLGETVAETKTVLTKLKNSQQQDRKS